MLKIKQVLRMEYFAGSGIPMLPLIFRTCRHLFFIIIFIIPLGCKSPNGPGGGNRLSVDGVSCTEVWLRINAGVIPLPSRVTIIRDGQSRYNFALGVRDTVVYDNTLTPNHTYTYQIHINQKKDQTITLNTLDTSSNSVSWQRFEFGDKVVGSRMSDIAIINENNIWAVGQIYLNDSLGHVDVQPYTVAHWDGKKWTLRKIFDANNQLMPDLRGILVLGPNDIWLTDGAIHHWDGVSRNMLSSYQRIDLIGGEENGQSVNRLWGKSSNDLYGIGWNGMITHFDGHNWKKLETGTNLHITDIHGAMDEITGEMQILATATTNYPSGRAILSIKGNTATSISYEPLIWDLDAIWFIPNRHYYLAGDGIYEKASLADSLWENSPSKYTHHSTTKIKGNGINDVFIVGAYGEVLHFNGASWKSFISETYLDGTYNNLDVKGNIVAISGGNGQSGIVLIGKRK
ncbi:MAG TPA: hypothetical protein VHO03_00505 [Ignavibacteriales bacterium]|nr:hypothetical protein [Ignavibacteriales bacterium]